jgi:hypothetical protein
MRTTITLDSDVAARLERLRAGRRFKELVNDALRRGLDALEEGEDCVSVYSLEPVTGRPRRSDLDNVAELLAETDGDGYR